MPRITALLLALILIFEAGVVSAGDVGMGGKRPDTATNIRFLDPNNPGKGNTFVETYTPNGKTLTIAKDSIITEGAYRKIINIAAASAANDFTKQEGETSDNLLTRAVNNTKLFVRGFQDVWKATTAIADTGMANLNDPQKRYEFWKEQGIYDKYNARERAFLNKMVFPAVAAAQGIFGLGGAVLIGVGAAAAFQLAAGPLVIGAAATWLALTTVKALRVKGLRLGQEAANGGIGWDASKGGDITSMYESSLFSLATKTIGFVTGASLFTHGAVGSMLGEARMAGELAGFSEEIVQVGKEAGARAGAAVGVAGGLASALGGVLGIRSSYNFIGLVNAWGIPEPQNVTPVMISKRDIPGDVKETMDIKLTYRLAR